MSLWRLSETTKKLISKIIYKFMKLIWTICIFHSSYLKMMSPARSGGPKGGPIKESRQRSRAEVGAWSPRYPGAWGPSEGQPCWPLHQGSTKTNHRFKEENESLTFANSLLIDRKYIKS